MKKEQYKLYIRKYMIFYQVVSQFQSQIMSQIGYNNKISNQKLNNHRIVCQFQIS
jgi:hypothetical protein